MASETSLCRERLVKYCKGDGLDIGFGGDPIVETAICIDLPVPYAKVGTHPQHLHGNAKHLHWFKDGVLDYVYSSHLFEDFTLDEMSIVLFEWARVLRPGGHLILYLPNEQKYRKHCEEKEKPRNINHKIDHFNMALVKDIAKQGSPNMNDRYKLEIVHEDPECEEYSFEIVFRKTERNV